MIYTVTLNPALDYIVTVKDFELGKTNRTATEMIFPGGKGINVSIVLGNLGIKNKALGFVAGFVGDEIIKRLKSYGVDSDFIKLQKGNSRINVKLTSIDGTEINGQGPDISKEEFEQFLYKMNSFYEDDIVVLSGSVPSTMPGNTYQLIMERLYNKGITTVVDAAGNLLTNVLQYHPFLIKPNNHELGELFGVEIKTWDEAAKYAAKLQEKGARNVFVSMGAKGGVLVTEKGEVFKEGSPAKNIINTVGAGDSLVAGFIAGYLNKKDYEYAFRMGMATGAASAASENLATEEDIIIMLNKM